MKRITSMTILIIILALLLSSCSFIKEINTSSLNSSTDNKEKSSDIIIQSPMTLSNNDMFSVNGKHEYLRLKMVKGKYYEDWNPGEYMGTVWKGYFVFELANEAGNTIAQTDLSKIYREELIFNSPFQIQFDDYNNDGDIDFTIGQYASSNGRDYKLFTLRRNGEIQELPVKDNYSLFISNTTGYYSAKLIKVDDRSFKTYYYDNSKGKIFENIFRWDGKEFIKAGSHEINNN